MPCHILLHGYGIYGANLSTKTTTFTGDGVNFEILNSAKSADILTQRTLGAFLIINMCRLSAPELTFLLKLRVKKEMEISSINVAINKHFALSDGSE